MKVISRTCQPSTRPLKQLGHWNKSQAHAREQESGLQRPLSCSPRAYPADRSRAYGSMGKQVLVKPSQPPVQHSLVFSQSTPNPKHASARQVH
jgi:hypothetical protein